MYQQLPFKDFIATLWDLTRNKRNGAVFVVAKNGDWGKIELRKGEIVSVTFKSAKGRDALPLLSELGEVQFLFQEQRGPVAHGAAGQGPNIPLSEFFHYFGHVSSAGASSQPDFEATQPIDPEVVRQARQHHKGKVLVVDDSAIARKAARIPLEVEGYQVIEAKDGFEALGQLQNESPHIVLLDLVMPGIDGYRVLELIRGNPKFRELPVIMLTSRDGLMDRLKGRMSDLDEYLTKPFEPVALVRLVAKHIDK